MARGSKAAGRTEITIKDIAARLGVSHATVSRALNDHPATSDETKARVRDAAEALGYVRNSNAGSLSGTASRLVGFVAPDVQNDFYATCAQVLAERCALAGYQLVMAISEDDPELEQQHVLALRQARAAGVVITPTAGLLDRTAALLKPLPLVQLIRSNPKLDRRWVGIDDHTGVKLATQHLLELGHRRIGFIGGFETLTTGHDRQAGYRDALAAMGLPFDQALAALGPPRRSFGVEATLALIARNPDMTGLVLGSSTLTLGALQAFQQKGIQAPADLSVVGYSDPEWFRIWGAGLTTIGLPVEEIATCAAQVLFDAMRPGAHALSRGRGGFSFQPQLVERGSAAAPPGQNRVPLE